MSVTIPWLLVMLYVASGSESCLIDRKPVILLGLMSIVTIRRKVVVQRRCCCCWKKIIGAIQSWMNTSSEGPSDLASAQHFHCSASSSQRLLFVLCSSLSRADINILNCSLIPLDYTLLLLLLQHSNFFSIINFFPLFGRLPRNQIKSLFVRHNQEIDGATDKSHYLPSSMVWQQHAKWKISTAFFS